MNLIVPRILQICIQSLRVHIGSDISVFPSKLEFSSFLSLLLAKASPNDT